MQNEIKTYPVQHPLLRRNIRFFWEIRSEHMSLNHKLIPQRNINMRFNLNDTRQYIFLNGNDHLLEKVYFSGLQDHYINAFLKFSGKVHMLGICFFPEGFYPFFKIPVSEFKNNVIGTSQAGFAIARTLSEKLADARDTKTRLIILENELLKLLVNTCDSPEKFRMIFNALKSSDNPRQITEFCTRNNLGIRSMERMYNKYIGVSGSTYSTLNRFHKSMNMLLKMDFSRLSDLAYDNGYFDQMHFIKDFKRFSGDTPKAFIQQNNSILQIGKLE
jgi:AraC-like DNA-binding protein